MLFVEGFSCSVTATASPQTNPTSASSQSRAVTGVGVDSAMWGHWNCARTLSVQRTKLVLTHNLNAHACAVLDVLGVCAALANDGGANHLWQHQEAAGHVGLG